MTANNNESEKDQTHSTTYGDMLRKYYFGRKYVLITEGILKLACFVLCSVSITIFMVHEVCTASKILLFAFPIGTGISIVMIAIVYIGALTRWSQCLPEVWLYADIILSTAAAVITLTLAILSMSHCSYTSIVDLIPGLVGILTSILLAVSVAVTYVSSTLLWNKIGNESEELTM